MRREWKRTLGVLLTVAIAALPGWAVATTVRIETPVGPLDIELYDTQAPITVANFLTYVRDRAYDRSIVHRSARIGSGATSTPFVIQGGGFYVSSTTGALTGIATRATIQNEYAADRPNVRGSVAMAKQGGNPNSATSQWFINMVDNTTTLGPTNNGGFTVFGRLTTPSLAVADAIAALPRLACASPYGELPVLVSNTTCTTVVAEQLVMSPRVRELSVGPTANASDRVFNYLEAVYPQYAAPATNVSQIGFGYYYRHYTKTNAYLGTRLGRVYYLLPENNGVPVDIGTIDEWVATAAAAGY